MPDFPTPETLATTVMGTPEASPIQGPVTHPETGTITHLGLHSTQIVHHAGRVERIAHGESFTPSKDGAPAMLLKTIVKGA